MEHNWKRKHRFNSRNSIIWWNSKNIIPLPKKIDSKTGHRVTVFNSTSPLEHHHHRSNIQLGGIVKHFINVNQIAQASKTIFGGVPRWWTRGWFLSEDKIFELRCQNTKMTRFIWIFYLCQVLRNKYAFWKTNYILFYKWRWKINFMFYFQYQTK